MEVPGTLPDTIGSRETQRIAMLRANARTPRRLLRRAAAGRGERQVLVIGEARSGTSLLYRSLLGHPAFRGVGVNLVESSLPLVAHHAHALHEHERGWAVEAYLGAEAHAAFQRDIRPLHPLARRCGWRHDQSGNGALWWASGAPLVLSCYYWHARGGRGVRRVVDKVPSLADQARRLHRVLPSATLVYIHRHPVDVLASYRKRLARDPGTQGVFGLDVDQFVRRWRRRTAAVLAARDQHRVPVHVVSYTDLTRRPKATLSELCRAVGEPWDAGMLHVPDTAMTAFRPDPLIAEPIVEHHGHRWTHVEPDEARMVEDLLGDLMARLRHETVLDR